MQHLAPPVHLKEVHLPDFGTVEFEPAVSRETYNDRVTKLCEMAEAAGYDAILVYGDREHASNVAFLTGYDPRFEEALAIFVAGRTPRLLVGNEGWSYADLAVGQFDKELFQSFSLMGQPRGASRSFEDILADFGIGPGAHVGTIGWKHFGRHDGLAEDAIEIPAYLVDVLRRMVGPEGSVRNAGALVADPADGLRVRLDVDELARMEAAATHVSQGLLNVLKGIRPGMTERQAARLMGFDGRPQSAHPMLSSGPRAAYGLPSPTDRRIKPGDPMTTAYAVWGALSARAGFLVHDETELPEGIQDYVPKLVAPYFSAVAAWYETIGIGVTGGAIFDAVMRRIGDPFFGVTLNPGHQIGMDEWVNSPIFEGSDIPLQSGMALQLDIIPATGTEWFTTNVEDGLALADSNLRDRFRQRHPMAWNRVEARRAFMQDTLGIRLRPEVLPFSNFPACLPPFWLRPDRIMAIAR